MASPLFGVLFRWSAASRRGRELLRDLSWCAAVELGNLPAYERSVQADHAAIFACLITIDLPSVVVATSPAAITSHVLFTMLRSLAASPMDSPCALSLGMAVGFRLSTVFGTLIPPLFASEFATTPLDTVTGRISLVGLAITVAGVLAIARDGARKDARLPAEAQTAAVAAFALHGWRGTPRSCRVTVPHKYE